MRIKYLEWAVGFFVIVSIAALALLAIKVSNVNDISNINSYELIAKFENVGGLKVRSPVKVGGVLVGRVHEIGLDKDMTPLVRMRIEKKYQAFPTETSAMILTAGLLGEQFISLSPGGNEEILKDGDRIKDTQSALILEELIGKFLFSDRNKDL